MCVSVYQIIKLAYVRKKNNFKVHYEEVRVSYTRSGKVELTLAQINVSPLIYYDCFDEPGVTSFYYEIKISIIFRGTMPTLICLFPGRRSETNTHNARWKQM